MLIRRARPEEAQEIRSLIVEAVRSSCTEDFEANGWENFLQPNTPEALAQRIASEDYLTLVCETQDRLAGVIAVRSREKINQLFVHPACRRLGIASRLWREAKSICERSGGSGNYSVRSSTMGVPVYRSFGFRIAGARQFESGIAYYPMVLMADS